MIRFSMLTDLGNYLRVRGEYSMTVTDQFAQAELPPRTRRIHKQRRRRRRDGTTSAYAENTHGRQTVSCTPRNYLRVRGEYLLPFCLGIIRMELPPRTRRILRSKLLARLSYGTTSAYAENTSKNRLKSGKTGNYLRVRGEYSDRPLKTLPVSELPPRTRRILFDNDFRDFPRGTTSAYAENTCYRGADRCDFRNYLRVRGEYPTYLRPAFLHAELPPRTRRIHGAENKSLRKIGTTSAYAENTWGAWPALTCPRNYLRVRGEYTSSAAVACSTPELPPRTRRIPFRASLIRSISGTTSAYAENTFHHSVAHDRRRNYLRVRGEYATTHTRRGGYGELPPRTRRIRVMSDSDVHL